MVGTKEAAARSGLASTGEELVTLLPELVVATRAGLRVEMDQLVGEVAPACVTLEVLERTTL